MRVGWSHDFPEGTWCDINICGVQMKWQVRCFLPLTGKDPAWKCSKKRQQVFALKLQANFVWLSHLVNFSQVQVAAALGQFGTGAAFPQVSIVDLKQPQQQKKQNKNQNENKYVHFKKMVSDRIWRIDLYSSLVRYELCHLVCDNVECPPMFDEKMKES